MKYNISVVIRTYNEQKHIGEVLESIRMQTYYKYEVVLVDSESTDDTLKIAGCYDVKVVNIKKADFNYSYASNVGISNTTGDIICFLSGHSVPVRKTYLNDINEVFQNKKVGACYGDVVALPDGSWVEKTFNGLGYIKNRFKSKKNDLELECKIHPGIFSCSNAAAWRELLLKHPFAVGLGHGGEDVEVAYRIIEDGYYIAKVPELLVMHSHGSNLRKFIKEFRDWRIMYEDVKKYIVENR